MSAERLLFVFLDGVGLGADDADTNPFAAARTPVLERLASGKLTRNLEPRTSDGFVFRHLDASLGLDGLPQSATGQTTLLTGQNGALVMGRHYGPWPGPTLRRVLDEGTLFGEVLDAGRSARLANVYPPGYFAALEAGKQRTNVPVYAARAAGLPLLTLERYQAGEGSSVDLSGTYLRRFFPGADDLTPAGQGARLARNAAQHAFTFFDFWPSDETGHRGTFAEAVGLVERLDAFLGGVLDHLDRTTLLVTSDHGNLEDKTVRTHTFAKVPLLVTGPGAGMFSETTSLLDVAPAVRHVLEIEARSEK